MSTLWTAFVHEFEQLLDILTQTLGGHIALAIVVVSLAVRLLLLPWSYRAARDGWHRQRIMKSLQPRLRQLRERHKDDPQALWRATQTLHREHGLAPVPLRGLGVTLVQAPIALALLDAIRHGVAQGARSLWLGPLARPNLWLALGVALLTALAAHFSPTLPEQARFALLSLQVLVTLAVVWHLGAGVGLYWGASSSVGLIQSMMLRAHAARHAGRVTAG